ncbi:VCBS repeat-containing protein [Streptomyces sp. NPDC006393]|uniref:FG-GAP repeat domain-containing protein n=1 Tax=Streptomyces sp. NPDC006393 TaxID=3156763 RepID=UPI0033EB3269
MTAPAAATAATGAGVRAAVPYPAGRTQLVSVGATGFLTWTDTSKGLWTSFADGSSTALPDTWGPVMGSKGSDVVLTRLADGGVDVTDMSTHTRLMTVEPRDIDPTGQVVGAVGDTVLVRTSNTTGGQDVHLVGTVGGEVSTRTVTRLPADATDITLQAGTPGYAVLVYKTPRGGSWALVDLSAATAVHRFDAKLPPSSVAVSGKYVAWVQSDAPGESSVYVSRRDTFAVQAIRLGATDGQVAVGLTGDWVTYGMQGGLTAHEPNPLYALTARNLTTGATRKVLDTTTRTATAPDGTLYASGGTVAGGEGLYRIAAGADGAPAATRVASSGEPTKVTLLGDKIPDVVDLDENGGRFKLEWQLSRINVEMAVTLRNTRTGETWRQNVYPLSVTHDDPHRAYLDWHGEVLWNGVRDQYTAAPSGPYTWTIDAAPLNGIGPHLIASGSFTVARKPGLHDYDADGSPDVLARDTSGRLWLKDVYDARYDATFQQSPETLVGAGWNVYDRIEASGNLGGAAVSDVVARDRDGVLWLYLGTGDAKSPLATRVRIGGGWNTYTQLTGGSDLNGDGRADLVATDKAGALWLYKGTGNYKAPFASRVKIGTGGWGTYNQITATGDIAGARAGDLVARDRDGVLWLYLGYGNGTFAPRTRIGGGWNTYKHLLGFGDADFDGRADLYGMGVRYGSEDPYFYPSTGLWQGPFADRVAVTAPFYEIRSYDLYI